MTPIEIMATAIVNGDWDELPELHKALATSQAKAALQAIQAAGYAIVPVDPSEETSR